MNGKKTKNAAQQTNLTQNIFLLNGNIIYVI